MEPDSKLSKIHKENADKALSLQRHIDLLESSAKVSDTVLSATSSLIRYLEGKTTKTEVINQLESIATPDALKVIPEIEALHATLKTHKNTDLSEVTKLMQGLLDQAKKLPKELPKPEKQQFIDYTKQFSSLSDAIKAVEKVVKAQKLIAEAPIVNVPETQVNVEAPDLKPLQTSIKDVVKAVNKIVIPEFKTDNGEVEKLLKQSNKFLKDILEKPVSGGGGGGGSSWTATGPTGYPAPLNVVDSTTTLGKSGLIVVNADGSPIGGGGGSGGLTDAQLRASAVPMSLASVPSHPVTNAGTFPVQVTSAPTTAVTGTFFQATQPVSLATNTPVIAAGTNLIGKVGIDQTTPGTTNGVAITSLVYPASTGNNTTTQLAAAATFTGTVETILNLQAAQVQVVCDQPYTVVVNQYIDSAGLLKTSTDTFTRTAGQALNENITLPGNYFNITITNNGAATTTTLRVDITFGIMATSPRANTNLGNYKVAVQEALPAGANLIGTTIDANKQSVIFYAQILTAGTTITPSAGKRIKLVKAQVLQSPDNTVANSVTLAFTSVGSFSTGWAYSDSCEATGAVNEVLSITLGNAQPVSINIRYKEL